MKITANSIVDDFLVISLVHPPWIVINKPLMKRFESAIQSTVGHQQVTYLYDFFHSKCWDGEAGSEFISGGSQCLCI